MQFSILSSSDMLMIMEWEGTLKYCNMGGGNEACESSSRKGHKSSQIWNTTSGMASVSIKSKLPLSACLEGCWIKCFQCPGMALKTLPMCTFTLSHIIYIWPWWYPIVVVNVLPSHKSWTFWFLVFVWIGSWKAIRHIQTMLRDYLWGGQLCTFGA